MNEETRRLIEQSDALTKDLSYKVRTMVNILEACCLSELPKEVRERTQLVIHMLTESFLPRFERSNVPALCAAIRELDAKHAEERAAWVEHVSAILHFDSNHENFLEEAVQIRESARQKLVALGVPADVFP